MLFPLLLLLTVLFHAQTVAAQTTARPAPAVEFTGGYAGFADEGIVGHGLFGGAFRFHLSPRISVGPEVQYMFGSGSHRDLLLTGNLTFDVLSPTAAAAPRRVTPFLVVGGGLFRTTDSAFGESFSHNEGGFTGGGGVRAWINDRAYVASEFRIGWELHFRVSGTVGVRLGG